MFGLEGCFGVGGEADPGGDAEDVGIDGHVGLLVDDGGDDVGGFAAYAGEFDQFGDGGRYFSIEVFHDHLGHADEVFGFIVRVADATDEGEEVVEGGLAEAGDVGILLEDGGGGHIDPFIGALCGEDNGYQELVGIIVDEFSFCVGCLFFEIVQYECETLFFCHAVKIKKVDDGRPLRWQTGGG